MVTPRNNPLHRALLHSAARGNNGRGQLGTRGSACGVPRGTTSPPAAPQPRSGSSLNRRAHDLICVPTPAVGAVDHSHQYLGVNESIGLQHIGQGRLQVLRVEVNIRPPIVHVDEPRPVFRDVVAHSAEAKLARLRSPIVLP